MANRKKDPTFDKQLDYSKENDNGNDPVFSHAYHQFMVNLLTARDKTVKNELINEVKQCNAAFSDKLICDVNEVIEKQWIRVLDEKLTAQSKQLNDTMTIIASDIVKINQRMKIAEEKVMKDESDIELLKKRADYKKKIIEELQAGMKILRTDAIEELMANIKEVTPILITVKKNQEYYIATQKWTVIAKRIAIAVLISVTIMSAILTLTFYNHNKQTGNIKILPKIETPLCTV